MREDSLLARLWTPPALGRRPAGAQGPGSRRAYEVGRDDAGLAPNLERGTARISAGHVEERLAPLRTIARELTARGMPTGLVSELLAEIVAEFGNQVLESERHARLAVVEQLLARIPLRPLMADGAPPRGMYLITGPSGSGKSVLIAHLAHAAARQGLTGVVLVNTESSRIGAAAQMNALGVVFGYDVEHMYMPQELRRLASSRGPDALILVEAAGWSPRDDTIQTTSAATPWKWRVSGATVVICVPATAQGDDLRAILTTTREKAANIVAVLSKTDETRNVLPALGALALSRQPLGMVVPGPDLMASVNPPDLGSVARSALGVVMSQRKAGRVRC